MRDECVGYGISLVKSNIEGTIFISKIALAAVRKLDFSKSIRRCKRGCYRGGLWPDHREYLYHGKELRSLSRMPIRCH